MLHTSHLDGVHCRQRRDGANTSPKFPPLPPHPPPWRFARLCKPSLYKCVLAPLLFCFFVIFGDGRLTNFGVVRSIPVCLFQRNTAAPPTPCRLDDDSTVRHAYPSSVPGVSNDWFAEHMLPEGAHNHTMDWTVMFLNRDKPALDEDWPPQFDGGGNDLSTPTTVREEKSSAVGAHYLCACMPGDEDTVCSFGPRHSGGREGGSSFPACRAWFGLVWLLAVHMLITLATNRLLL